MHAHEQSNIFNADVPYSSEQTKGVNEIEIPAQRDERTDARVESWHLSVNHMGKQYAHSNPAPKYGRALGV